jgi:hypothetical protein
MWLKAEGALMLEAKDKNDHFVRGSLRLRLKELMDAGKRP